jgi:hypothetical protein|tara:strand:- start:1443 stop:2303 length:861 start_codon:yes stop_codon:yes gene_type:complete
MFRRGGSAGEGITSGLRRGYAFGSTGPQRDYLEAKKNTPTTSGGSDFDLSAFLSEPPEPPKSSAGADFWLNFGTNILAQPGGRPILQTLGTAGKEPLARYQQQRGQEDLLKYKHAQGERQFQLEIYKALSDKDKHALQQKIDYLVDKFGLTPQEALNRALPEFRKPINPQEKAWRAEQAEQAALDSELDNIISGLGDKFTTLDKKDAMRIKDAKDFARDNDLGYDLDASIIIDRASWSNFGNAVDDDENITLTEQNFKNFRDGYVYVDIVTGNIYEKQGPKLIKKN